ncbi:MAG: DNA alkylation repair protein [Chitinophagaceae bacterium]
MTLQEVMTTLKSMGSESTKKTLLRHGATEPFFGVKVGDMKKLLKPLKNNQQLAMELYDTSNSDAMYLAGLVANGALMTKKQLQGWVSKAPWHMISEYTVPWVTSESPLAWELALEWIDSKKEHIAAAGWCTLSAIVSLKPDAELDITALKALLQRVEKNIHQSQNRVKYTMNGFVIALGAYVVPLTSEAVAAGKRIGTVTVNMGDTACEVPSSPGYIQKIKDRGSIGKKKKTVKC